ncbi:MAG: RnfABCDGE type electron transport complex subunit D [Clostridiales bacterium]|nr:RnfABCDGE type electron transport complex subunit D [Clostridiales bacterium]
MNNSLVVSSYPHIRSKETVSRIMLDVILALVPAAIASVIIFGWRSLLVIGVSVLSAVISEALIQKIMKKPITIKDLSAVVTGILLAYNLSPAVPLWIVAVGAVIAIVLVKQVFGGLGQNFMNPALAARAILLAAWPVQMTTWKKPIIDAVANATSSATPLPILKDGETWAKLPPLMDVFVGKVGGSIGEISALALLIGAGYLLIRKVINWRIPASFIGTVALLTWIFGYNGLFTGRWEYHIFSGGLMLGAFFMANDYATSPVTPKGQIIMGIGCGVITTVIRLAGGYPDGVSYSILIMNIAAPLIERYTRPRIYGEVKANV